MLLVFVWGAAGAGARGVTSAMNFEARISVSYFLAFVSPVVFDATLFLSFHRDKDFRVARLAQLDE